MHTREIADLIVADLESFARAAKPAADKPPAKPAAEKAAKDQAAPKTALKPDAGGGDNVPLDAAKDPEAIKEEILAEVRDILGWDGEAGDPNASKDAFEDALADMLDCDVEIVWDGKGALTLKVEGEDPIPLTLDFLGELLEALSKQGGEGDAEAVGGDEGDDAAESGERALWAAFERGRKLFDENKVNRDPGGPGGGRFIPTGASAAGAVAEAAKTAAKTAGKTGAKAGGKSPGLAQPHAVNLAKRAGGRSGPRKTAKAAGDALSAGTGSRVKVSGNKDGSFNVGPKKKKLSGKAMAAVMIASWLAFGAAGGFLAVTLGLPVGFGIAAAAVAQIALFKALKG